MLSLFAYDSVESQANYILGGFMKAIAFRRPGAPDVLEMMDVEDPQLVDRSVMIRVTVSGVSFRDIMLRREYSGGPRGFIRPMVPGLEVAGEVLSVGTGVTDLVAGSRVCAVCPGGGYGEIVVVPRSWTVALPSDVSDLAGAATPLCSLTAWHLVNTATQVKRGDTVLVHAASGGVGTMLVQFAVNRGATVIAAVGSHEKFDAVRALGAKAVVSYGDDPDWCLEVALDITQGRGVDIVFDGVGSATMSGNLHAVKRFGHLVCFGDASGQAQLSLADLRPKSLRASSFSLFNLSADEDVWSRGFAALRSGASQLSTFTQSCAHSFA